MRTTALTAPLTITFNENVSGLDISDFTLTRAGVSVTLTASMLAVTSNSVYTLNLSSVSSLEGEYVLTLNATSSGIKDGVTNAMITDASVTWGVATSQVTASPAGIITFDDTGVGTDEVITFVIIGDRVRISDPLNVLAAGTGATQVNLHTIDVPLAGVTGFVINGGAGDDSLTLDFANGNPVPGNLLTFNGGTGGNDVMHLKNTGSLFDLEVFTYQNVTDGNVVLTNEDGTIRLNYTGLDPLTVDGTPSQIIFNLTSLSDLNVVLADNIANDGFMRLSGSTFELTDFGFGSATSITINGLGGVDVITVSSIDAQYTGSLTINGGDGNDTLSASAANFGVTLLGGVGNDRLIGSSLNDSLGGGSGNDNLTAGSGDDKLSGGSGNDVLNGETGIDCYDETVTGNVTITNTKLIGGNIGSDILLNLECVEITGDSRDNLLDASKYTLGSVVLHGMDGNDTLLGGSHGDTLDGGNGIDQVKQTSGQTQTLTGTQLIGNGTDSLTSIERANLTAKSAFGNIVDASAFNGLVTLTGGNGPDQLRSSIIGSVINGGSGKDTITGGNGYDNINGGTGDDNITGGVGLDTIYGGTGNDIIDGGIGADLIYGGDGRDKIDGGEGNDTIDGGASNDANRGNNGDDSITGGAGDDTLLGDDGRDILAGNIGYDIVLGGDGNDRIEALSADTISGGPGNDSIVGVPNKIDEAFTVDFDKLLV